MKLLIFFLNSNQVHSTLTEQDQQYSRFSQIYNNGSMNVNCSSLCDIDLQIVWSEKFDYLTLTSWRVWIALNLDFTTRMAYGEK